MARGIDRHIAAPLMFLNMVMYAILLGFASWCVNKYINGQTNHPSPHPRPIQHFFSLKSNHASFGGNGATPFFLTFAILAGVVGLASKLAGGHHLRAWRNDSLASAASASLIAWAITALALGLACKEIHIGGWRGWRLRVVEAFSIVLGVTQLLYVMMLHAGMFNSRYGPEYRDTDYGMGPGPHVPESDKPSVGVPTV